jgi:hypothetical protein
MAELFHVTLTGDQELPSVQTQAHGEGTVRWDPEAQTATYHLHFTGVDFSNYATNGRHKGHPFQGLAGSGQFNLSH